MKKFINRVHCMTLERKDSNWVIWVLFLASFADASLLPLPSQTYFLFLVLLNPEKSPKYLFSAITGTLAGSVAGYYIGRFAFLDINGEFTSIAKFLFNNIPGFSLSAYNNIQLLYTKWNLWIVVIASFTPVPYAVLSVSAGIFGINPFIFCLATVICQTVKFVLLAWLFIKVYPKVKMIFKPERRRLALIAVIGILTTIMVFRVF
jgi:membrane protein YqaA with SNARE-associated domain